MPIPTSQTDKCGPAGRIGDQTSRDVWYEKIAQEFEPKSQFLIPILQFVQSEAGYLPPSAMLAASRFLKVPDSKVYGVASFYAQFYFEPRGKSTLAICRGTACHVRGSARLVDELSKYLGVCPGGTTEDMSFTLETVACVGACALAPTVVINDTAHGRLNPATLKKLVDAVRQPSGVVIQESRSAGTKTTEAKPMPVEKEKKVKKEAAKKPPKKKPAKKKPAKKKPAKKKPAKKKPAKKKPAKKKPAKKKPAKKKPAKKKPAKKKPAKKTRRAGKSRKR